MQVKKIVLSAIFFLIIASVASSAFASSFTVNAVAIQNRIYSDEAAEYTLTIRNSDTITNRFILSASDPSWRLVYEENVIEIDPSQKKDVFVQLRPTSGVQDGKVYAVPISIRSLTSDSQEDIKLDVILDSDSVRVYKPSVAVSLIAGDDNKIDPSKPVDIKLRFTNKNSLDIKNLQVKVSSPLFVNQFVTKLGPKDDVTKIISADIDSRVVPQDLYVDVEIVANNISLGRVTRQLAQIIPSEPGFTRDVITDVNSLLYREYAVALKNIGNVESTETVQMDSSLWQRLFTQSDFPVKYEKQDKNYVANFAVTIGPGSGVEFRVVQNYKPFAYTTGALVLIILIATVLYYTFRSAIVVSRKIYVTAGDQDGVSKMKVVMNVKNRTGLSLENVKVIERTPNITEVDKEFVVGTLKPTKIVQNAHKGTLIRWDFSMLEPFEERIITYNVNSKLSIVGNVDLPATLVKYDRSGKTRTIADSSHKSDDFI